MRSNIWAETIPARLGSIRHMPCSAGWPTCWPIPQGQNWNRGWRKTSERPVDGNDGSCTTRSVQQETIMEPTLAELAKRIETLEHVNAIKDLKARYWSCVDRMKLDDVRDCFAAQGA